MKYTKVIDESQTQENINTIDQQTSQEISDTPNSKHIQIEDISFKEFSKQSLNIAFPGILFFICYSSMGMLNLIFIGQMHNNDDMLKGMGISNLYINCTLMAIVHGILSGLDTLLSNAYSLKKYKLMGIYLNRARIIGYSITIVIVTIHYFTIENVLRLFRLNEDVIKYGTKYAHVLLIYIFFDVHAMCCFRYLNVVRKSHINFIFLLTALILHPLWNYIFIVYLDMDVLGAGISYCISRLIVFIMGSVYLHFFNPVPETYFFFTKACFRGLWDFTKFSFGAMLIFCAEWWAYEIQALIAINIGEDDYAVHVILAQFASVVCSISIGFNFATTILVGEYIAKASTKVVKKATYYSLLLGFAVMFILMLVLFFLRNYAFRLFIDIERLINKGTPIIPIFCIYEIFDLIQSVLCSALRGLRKQFVASFLTLIQFYLIQTSMAYIIGKILGWGVYGMWVGMAIGNLSAIVLYSITFVCVDIHKIHIETIDKLEKDHNEALIANVGSKDVENDEDDERVENEKAHNENV